MDGVSLWSAALLGLIEGLTEFIPVSSTGHLILMVDLLGFQGPPGKVFEIVVQLGAILAVVILYFKKLFGVVLRAPYDHEARRFLITIAIAFLPAMVVGALAHGVIKAYLFSPWVVAVNLVLGGFAIIALERRLPHPTVFSVEEMTPKLALKVGFAQCLAMVPGVSRSGATILGALFMGVERKTAAEFSFFLAVPTMAAATAYDLMKNWSRLDGAGGVMIAVGFAVAFLAAAAVVKTVIEFIGKHGFTPFGWYRIFVGALMLGVLIAR